MRTLSERQQRILSFLNRFLEEKGYPPSIRDIGKACGVSSTSVVDYNLDILEREGYLRRDRDVSRGIELLGKDRNRNRTVRVPVIGRIAAGEPIPVPSADAWDTTASADTLEVTREVTGGREAVYALRVRGNSMIDALIGDGDIVLMQHTSAAENGEMVAVWLKAEKEATLKKLYREKDRVRLQPANAEMKPFYADPDNVEVQGRVIGVIRRH
ncbi:MAG: transcriptional repressor LexA [Chloroflexi bacterium]|nr:transcriptional repressor LexA [Chloroflexota bacterium]